MGQVYSLLEEKDGRVSKFSIDEVFVWADCLPGFNQSTQSMSDFFGASAAELDGLTSLDEKTGKPETKWRLKDPHAGRAIFTQLKLEDEDSAYKRMLVQRSMDFFPPHDPVELANKGQEGKFNITTGEAAAIKNDAVVSYLDLYVSLPSLVDMKLNPEIDPEMANSWAEIMGEEFTKMDRADDGALVKHLLLADTYVTHGVAVAFFDDQTTMRYSVGGLDKFKFPRKSGLVSKDIPFTAASGSYNVTDLYAKMDSPGWNNDAIKNAIQSAQALTRGTTVGDFEWEELQREIKSNSLYYDITMRPIEVIHCWVREFDQSVSYYVFLKDNEVGHNAGKSDEFLFEGHNYYDSMSQAFQLFAFGVGNSAALYTIRGIGFLIFQICNGIDVLHCKMMDNAVVGSSLLVETNLTDDAQDMQLIDSGALLVMPPGMKVAERPSAPDLSKTMIPALQQCRAVLNRTAGGQAPGDMMMNPGSDRRTKLEVSSQLDYINKLNSFAIHLFYGPYDNLLRERVRRAFTVTQEREEDRKAVEEMKQRCIDRGVPEEAFKQIDLGSVKAVRVIGNGSRASRIMLYEQMRGMYSAWDDVGRKNFDFDILVELAGVDKALRYAGKPSEKREPYDYQIANLENFELLEGDYMDPVDSENKMTHLRVHLEEIMNSMNGLETGEVDFMQWTMEYQMLYRHIVATLEMTTVHEVIQEELNKYNQMAQQVGEAINNGLRMIQKAQAKGELPGQEQQQAEGGEQANPEAEAKMKEKQTETQMKLKEKELLFQQQMQQEMAKHIARLRMIDEVGKQKQALATQQAMSAMIAKDAELQREMQRQRQ